MLFLVVFISVLCNNYPIGEVAQLMGHALSAH